MSSGDDNQLRPQASTPQQFAELFNSYFVSVFTAPSEIRTLSAHFTSSHPTLNELEIPVEMVLTSLKQLAINKATGSDGIPVRLLKKPLTRSHRPWPCYSTNPCGSAFSGRLETREYCTHFQERKERLCGELPPYFPSPCHLQSSRALCSGGSTRSYIPPHQSRTAWLLSWYILCDSADQCLTLHWRSTRRG